MSESSPVPKRIAVKFFADLPASAGSLPETQLAPFIELFHRFIQQQAVLGLLVDVADYAHVPQGPGVILIGHDVDYAIESTAGVTGLLTTRKHYAEDEQSLAEVLRDTLAKAVIAIRAIEEDGSTGVKFDTSRLEIQILDRLATRAEGALERLSAEIAPVLREVFETVDTVVATQDARRPAALRVSAEQAVGAAALCDRLSVSLPEPQLESPFEVDISRFKELRDAAADFVLIDVRESDEYEICNLGGELIPLGTLPDRLPALDKSAHLIVHCKGGGRGAKATKALRDAGFDNAWNLKGGILAWIDQVDPSLTRY